MPVLEIKIDLSAIHRLAELGAEVQQASDLGVEAAAQAVLEIKQAKIERTYHTEIPESATGRLLWERSGELRDGQAVQVLGEGQREVGPTNGAALYEGGLAELNTGADGINRSNPAAQETRDEGEPAAAAAFRAEIEKALANL